MGTFDDALRRRIDSDKSAEAAAEAASTQQHRERAADQLGKLFIELADYLNTNSSPTSVDLWEKRKRFSKVPRSPQGFILLDRSEYASYSNGGGLRSRHVVVLLPQGSLWSYNRSTHSLYPDNVFEGQIDLRAEFLRNSGYHVGEDYYFYADRDSGELHVSKIHDGVSTVIDLTPAEALFDIALPRPAH